MTDLFLPPIPRAPMFIEGVMTLEWQEFFRRLFIRVGGQTGGDLGDIEQLSIMGVDQQQPSVADLQRSLEDLENRISAYVASSGELIEDILAQLRNNQEKTATLSPEELVAWIESERTSQSSSTVSGDVTISTLSVASIGNPAAELSGESGDADTFIICYQGSMWTLYGWNSAGATDVPWVVDGSSGYWYAIAGRFVEDTVYINGTAKLESLTGGGLVEASATGYLQLLTPETPATSASEAHDVTGGDNVSQAAVEAALDALGGSINEINAILANINATT